MKINQKLLIIVLVLSICFSTTIKAQNLEKNIDSYISEQYTAETPGISILVAKDGKVIYKNGFGMANLELSIKTNPNHVFEIGSITKQFTAVAILMLEEQGKLKLTDDITKYIADYPTHGKTITIHNLLNHTSGIKSYTDVPSFMSLARTDMTPTELIDKFKNLPMDFDPDTEFRYNNSGYILLGYIIEVISGQSYADFIKTNIFDKVDMKNSYYGSMVKLIPNRSSGYSESDSSYRNANYLSLTLPYAAGSIMSTTEDLLKWQNALTANTLIKKSSLEKAINGSKLASGEEISYGYGFIKGNINGSVTTEHSGGIFGYSSNGIFLPEENVYVIGLSNCDCGSVGDITTNIAAMAIGKPFPKKEDAITLNDVQLKQWLGAYEFDNNIIRHITLKNNQLYSQREGSTNLEIYPMTTSNFIFDGGSTTYDFYSENAQRMVKMTTNSNTSIGKGIEKAPPSERKEIVLPTDILNEYVGKYELQPMFHISISVRDQKIYAVATGQSEFEIFASEKDKFFLKVVPAEIMFSRNTDGNIESLTLHQGGQQMLGKKIE